jgi:hypothetical protein
MAEDKHEGNRDEVEGGSEQTFPSPHWEWRRVNINRRRTASGYSVPKGHRWRKLPPRNWREPLTITVKYRGGAEAWVEVHARGDMGRFPGYVTVVELLMWVNSRVPG